MKKISNVHVNLTTPKSAVFINDTNNDLKTKAADIP